MYLVHKHLIKNTGQRPSLRRHCWVLSTLLPFVVGLHPPPLGPTLCHWFLPSVIVYLLSLGCTLHRWFLPYAVGFCPLSLGCTFCCWAVPSVVGLYPPPLGHALRRWVLPSIAHRWALVVVGLSLSLGSLCHWALVVGLSSPSSRLLVWMKEK
jgi:hypothetical protein